MTATTELDSAKKKCNLPVFEVITSRPLVRVSLSVRQLGAMELHKEWTARPNLKRSFELSLFTYVIHAKTQNVLPSHIYVYMLSYYDVLFFSEFQTGSNLLFYFFARLLGYDNNTISRVDDKSTLGQNFSF